MRKEKKRDEKGNNIHYKEKIYMDKYIPSC
jgi:hypothetical protein